jgi:transglutaminase-like putative cysteine protease
VAGVVDTQDTHGIVARTIERLPPTLYLRETALTAPDIAIDEIAEATRKDAGNDTLTLLHALMKRLNAEMTFDTEPTQAETTAAEAFAGRRGVCQDGTHIFIAAARHLGIPARYISGHFFRDDDVTAQDAGHAWAESYVDKLGWVGFDPTNGISPTEAHVRVAVGLDYLGAAPVRGTRYGGGGETLKVAVNVDQASWQSQS